MANDDDKVVSLADRRRADEARRKAEVAAQRKAAREAGKPVYEGQRVSRAGRIVGRVMAMVLWGVLLGVIVVFIAERVL